MKRSTRIRVLTTLVRNELRSFEICWKTKVSEQPNNYFVSFHALETVPRRVAATRVRFAWTNPSTRRSENVISLVIDRLIFRPRTDLNFDCLFMQNLSLSHKHTHTHTTRENPSGCAVSYFRYSRKVPPLSRVSRRRFVLDGFLSPRTFSFV